MILVEIVEIVVIAMVSYRLFRLLAVDDLTERPRDWLLSWVAWLADPWQCPWCLGFHCTLAVGLVAYFTGLTSGTPWLVVPAASVIVGFIGERT